MDTFRITVGLIFLCTTKTKMKLPASKYVCQRNAGLELDKLIKVSSVVRWTTALFLDISDMLFAPSPDISDISDMFALRSPEIP